MPISEKFYTSVFPNRIQEESLKNNVVTQISVCYFQFLMFLTSNHKIRIFAEHAKNNNKYTLWSSSWPLTLIILEASGQSTNFSLNSTVSMFSFTLPNNAQSGRFSALSSIPPEASAKKRQSHSLILKTHIAVVIYTIKFHN